MNIEALPNPFSIVTAVKVSGIHGDSRIDIYSMDGTRIRTYWLYTSGVSAQSIAWNGADEAGEYVTPGLYAIVASSRLGMAVKRILYLGQKY